MQVFQVIGILVVSIFVYAVIGFFISIIPADGDECLGWFISWLVGALLFTAVSYCWITGVPFPVLK